MFSSFSVVAAVYVYNMATTLEYPQKYTVVSGSLGAILHLCPGFVQSSRRTSVVNQRSTQRQCGESGGSQVV